MQALRRLIKCQCISGHWAGPSVLWQPPYFGLCRSPLHCHPCAPRRYSWPLSPSQYQPPPLSAYQCPRFPSCHSSPCVPFQTQASPCRCQFPGCPWYHSSAAPPGITDARINQQVSIRVIKFRAFIAYASYLMDAVNPAAFGGQKT
jgi:hypothetical protein